MALDRFNDDLNFVGSLGDDPKRDDGLSTPQFKSYFDKAGLAIQRFINNKLIPQIESAIDEGALLQQISAALNRKLDKAGGVMTGNIDMNGQELSGLKAPTADDEAATKGFVENAVKNVDVSGKVDKVNVVNNFATTEEGFVADARTVKVLNDKIGDDTGWVSISTDYKIHCRKIGSLCEVTITNQQFTGLTANKDNNIGTCPFKPFGFPFTRLYNDDGFVYIASNGSINLKPTETSVWVGASLQFFVNEG